MNTLIRGQKFAFSSFYDVAVIGGGSGGLAYALEGVKLGQKIVVFDYVVPSPLGSTWGLGGTCVNVGCIPKKLMHQSALLKEHADSARPYGWNFTSEFDWETLRSNVQNHIRAQNFGYKTNLKQRGIEYLNKMAVFLDNETLAYGNHEEIQIAIKTLSLQSLKQIKFKYCVIATGGRPTMLESVKDVAITSDDVFSLQKPPGKTLMIGGGYIALETAGFLRGLGYDVTSMTRGLYLREFDQGIAQHLMHYMEKHVGLRIVSTSLPIEATKQNNQIVVKYQNQTDKSIAKEVFDTVMVAVGRTANTRSLNLPAIGVKVNQSSQKIITHQDEVEKTHNDKIFAIGDVVQGIPELTPVASKSGQLLAHRISLLLRGDLSNYSKYKLDYNDYPTTVFTPLEYSCVGLSEERAQNYEVYHSQFTPLEEELCDKVDDDFQLLQKNVYCKAIVEKQTDRVLGLHYLGANAGEVMQGFAVAMKLGLKLSDLHRTVGIHPTSAEEFVQLKVTKSSGQDHIKHGC